MQWVKVTLPRDGKEANAWQHVQNSFETLFMATNAPEAAAMFSDLRMAGKPVTLYFSPVAAEMMSGILAHYEVESCEAPAWDAVALLVGHADARKILRLP